MLDNKFNDPSLFRNTAGVDFNGKSLNNVRFNKEISFHAIPENLTAELYVDQSMSYGADESSFLRLDPDEKVKLDGQYSIILISTLTSWRP